MKPWQFRQKTPGFGISRSFYLTVLAATARLPSILELVEPKGQGGAVPGFGVPLNAELTKGDLSRPMERGMYGVASRDRKTVLRLMVIPREEAGFDPSAFLRSSEAQSLSAEHLARIGATWTLLQLTFETHEAMVYPSLRFLLAVAVRLATLTQGVVSDPISRMYLLPEEVIHTPQNDQKVDARDFVAVKHKGDELLVVYTLGLQKFSMPELEMFDVPKALCPAAEKLLHGIAQASLMGKGPRLGGYVGSRKCPLQVVSGGLDKAQWEGIDCFELIPPAKETMSRALEDWLAETTQNAGPIN